MYSLFGLTYNSTTVKITKDIPASTSFNNYASAVGNQIEMTTQNFTANISTSINYSIKLPNTVNRLVLGIRGAYYIPFTNSKWTMNKANLDSSPNINPGVYAVHFMLGFSY